MPDLRELESPKVYKPLLVRGSSPQSPATDRRKITSLMSPQYTTLQGHSYHRAALTKAQKLMQAQKEDPRYRDLDRMLARAYIELQRQRIQQKRSGVFMPRYVSSRLGLSKHDV